MLYYGTGYRRRCWYVQCAVRANDAPGARGASDDMVGRVGVGEFGVDVATGVVGDRH